MQQQRMLQGRETSVMLGSGSYGCVKEVTVNGKVYAGKFFYPELLESQNDGADRMSGKVSQEFDLMYGLEHPNITQFIGPCQITDYVHPVLLMEKLERNLHDLLENGPKLSLALKHSILKDVSSGLFYLHKKGITHRDLTAMNVLLTSSMDAKITDFGNSLILDDLTVDQKLTAMPGATLYMPPEALPSTNLCSYGPSLDIFSFGHLALFVLIQKFPDVLKAPTYCDPDAPERILRGRSEVERRVEYFDQLEEEISQGHGQMHKLVQLIKGCLDNDSSTRPTAEKLAQEMQQLAIEDESSRAILLLEKLLLGKCDKKLLLIAGKRGTGKSLFTRSLTMFGRLAHSVNIVEYSEHDTHSLKNSTADLILFCARMDGSFGVEDEQVITSLAKYYGNDFLRKTLIVLTMANNVKPMGPQRRQFSDHSFLQTIKDESMGVVREIFNKQKLRCFPELDRRFVLAGAPDMSHDGRMIPDVQSNDHRCRIDWIVPVAQTLLNLI